MAACYISRCETSLLKRLIQLTIKNADISMEHVYQDVFLLTEMDEFNLAIHGGVYRFDVNAVTLGCTLTLWCRISALHWTFFWFPLDFLVLNRLNSPTCFKTCTFSNKPKVCKMRAVERVPLLYICSRNSVYRKCLSAQSNRLLKLTQIRGSQTHILVWMWFIKSAECGSMKFRWPT
jgi:hypothetical protein